MSLYVTYSSRSVTDKRALSSGHFKTTSSRATLSTHFDSLDTRYTSHPDRPLVQMPASDNQPVQQAKQELDTLADRDADSTDSDVRYMAYAARLRTVLRAGTRYVAYVRLLF